MMKEKIVGTLSAGMSSMKKGIQSGVDSCKLEGKISEQHHLIKKLKKEIGNLVTQRLDAGDEMSPEIRERYQAILEAKAEIECLEKSRKVVKVVCPGCGHKTSVKMNYCGKCGALLKTEVDMFEEQVIENELFEEGEE